MSCGKVHTQVAEALDDAISGAETWQQDDTAPKRAFEVRRQGFEPRTR